MLEPGSQIGRYEIQRRLGRGGMGSVYVAHDPVLGRMVAIKVFAGDLDIPDARERFSREARAAAALNHPNIVTIYDFGEYSSQPFIVMEYVSGETLLAVIRRKAPVSMVDKLRWMDELCAGVGYAHGMSVIHRDLKPANLMIDRSGRLKILDFGVARMMGTASNTVSMVGTPGYMSPEQIHGDAVDHRSDLFSVGVVLYELLSYKEAFPGDTVPTIVHRVLSGSPVSLADLVPEVGPEVVGIVDRLLEKKPSDRFEDAESLRGVLVRVRRKIASDSSSDEGLTRILRRDTPPAFGGGGRGTGSARKGVSRNAGVAQLTPPPDPRGTDPEALALRRVEQLNAALARARGLLAAGDLEDALEECQQALTFGEDNVDALALEQEINVALDARFNVGRTTRGSGEFSPREAVEATVVPMALPAIGSDAGIPAPLAVPGPGNAGANADVQRGDTVLAPARRTPAPAQPAQQRRQTLRTLKTRAIDLFTKVWEQVREIQRKIAAYPRRVKLGVGAAVLLLAAGVAALTMRPAVVPMGTLVIDATPWASIDAIESEGGQRQPLPPQATTPLSLSIPEGSYWITLTGPPPASQSQRVSVNIAAGGRAVMPTVRFGGITPDEYFEQYLSSPVPIGDPAAPSPPGETDVAPPAPSNVPSDRAPSSSPSGVGQ